MRLAKTFALLLVLVTSLAAHDYIPGEKQSHPILLSGGNVFTVSGDMLPGHDILFEDGRITRIERGIPAPPGCEVVDVSGKNVYPGLIACGTTLGLTEIGSVRATNDSREIGRVTPEVMTHTAYNPDSELQPTVRANGITTVQVAPDGRLLRGRSCILHLDGWTVEEAAVKLIDGMHMSWPATGINTGWWESRSPEEQRRDQQRNRDQMASIFEDALAYHKARLADPKTPVDLRLEAMAPLFSGDLPLYVSADDSRQIEEAVVFCRERAIKLVIVGAREAYKVADLLRENDVPVIYGSVQVLPGADQSYDLPFRIPKMLKDAGVKFCISNFSSWGSRNLPWQAGQAAAYGLDGAEALRSVTLSAAEILGIGDQQGSIEVGKKATIVVSDGDILDYMGHNVIMMYIDGRKIDLDSKHKELYRKYQARKAARQ